MSTNLDTDRDLRRYLLGTLPEEAQDALEVRLLADPDLHHAVQAAEDDLVDDYARGLLDGGERAAFEDHVLRRPGLAQRVAFARSLERALAESASSAPHTTEGEAEDGQGHQRSALPTATAVPWTERLSRWLGGGLGFGSASPALRLAGAAAVLLLLVTAGWLAFENAQLDRRVAQLEAHRESLEREQAALRTSLEDREATLEAELSAARATAADGTTSAGELAEARERIDELEGELTELRRKPPPRKVAVSFLLALATRSAGVRDLVVPETAETVELQLDAAGDAAAYERFRVQVLGAGGTEVWSRTGLLGDPGSGTVDVELPAPVLAPGRYEVLLEGLGTGGPQLVGAYEFEVARR